MSNEAGPSNSARPILPLPHRAKSQSAVITPTQALKILRNAPGYVQDADYLEEQLLSLKAKVAAQPKQQNIDDYGMESRLGKAVFIRHLHELLGRLEPKERKGWLTHAASVAESTVIALVKYTGIKGLDTTVWYRGIGWWLDGQEDPVECLWKLLFPLLEEIRACADFEYKRTVPRQPIAQLSLPPRRDYTELANTDPTKFPSDELVELVIPPALDSSPTTHPGLLNPKRLEGYHSSSRFTWERDFVQIRLCEEVRSNPSKFMPLLPTTTNTIVMPRDIFESIAWEADAEIRLSNLRWMVAEYRGKMTLHCFNLMELIEELLHSNLSFGSDLDARGFFELSDPLGRTVISVPEHWAGTCLEALWKLAREECLRDGNIDIFVARSNGYFKWHALAIRSARCEFRNTRPSIPRQPVQPAAPAQPSVTSQSSTSAPEAPAPAGKRPSSKKRKYSDAVVYAEDVQAEPSAKRREKGKGRDTRQGSAVTTQRARTQHGKRRQLHHGHRGYQIQRGFSRAPMADVSNTTPSFPTSTFDFRASSSGISSGQSTNLMNSSAPAWDASSTISTSFVPSHIGIESSSGQSQQGFHLQPLLAPPSLSHLPPPYSPQWPQLFLNTQQPLLLPTLILYNDHLVHDPYTSPIPLNAIESAVLLRLYASIHGYHNFAT